MSRIDLSSADAEPLEFSEQVTAPSGTGGEDVVSLGHATIAGKVERTSRGFKVSGWVEAVAHLRCVRCLEEFSLHLHESMEVELLPLAVAPREEETQLGRADLDTRFFTEPVVELAELAAEQIELALPMKPVCSSSCRGLCPRCGANLNVEVCGCPVEADSRWEALADWRPSN